jgi:hypothetical protein
MGFMRLYLAPNSSSIITSNNVVFAAVENTSRKIRSKETIKNNIVMDTVNVIDENKNQVLLRMVQVIIRGMTTIETCALCDKASTVSKIDRKKSKEKRLAQ